MDNTVAMATEYNSYTSGLLFNFYWPFSGMRHLLVNSHSLCELVELHKQVNTKDLRNTLVLIFMNYTPFRYPPVIHAWVIIIMYLFLLFFLIFFIFLLWTIRYRINSLTKVMSFQ